MAVKPEDFLLQWFMQKRFNDMPAEKYATFMTYLKNGDDFRGNMKDWKNKLMHQSGNNWVKNDLPDPTAQNTPWTMTDAEWDKMLELFQDAFREMAANSDKFKADSPEKLFLDEYFGSGPNKLFSPEQLDPQVEQTEMDNLRNLLTQNQNLLYNKIAQMGWNNPFDADFTYQNLLDGLASNKKKYNSDSTFKKKLFKVLDALDYLASSDVQVSQLAYGQQQNQQTAWPDLERIKNGFQSAPITTARRDMFKDQYELILRRVYGEPDIRKNFTNNKISEALDKAESKMAYDKKDSEDYLPDKPDDTLTPWQQLEQWADNTYADVFEKYRRFKKDRLFFSPQAQNIVGALHGAKVKPTDGLDGIVKAASTVKSKLELKSASAVKHFDWLTKTLGEIKAIMPKAYAGALYNGRQLNAVISELIIRATRANPPKLAEAKTAMEIISVCKYGLTTSKIMDTLGKEQFTIFSDGKLSWNKSEGVAFVTKAMDKSIKAAFMGVGYGITTAVNAINLSGSKFNGKSRGVARERDVWLQQNEANRNATQAAYNQADQRAQNEITQHQQTLTALGQQNINAGNIDTHRQQLTNNRQTEEQQRVARENAQTTLDATNQTINDYNSLNQEIQNIQADIQRLNVEITALDAQLRAIQTPYPNAMAEMAARRLQAQMDAKMNDRDAKVQEHQTKSQQLNGMTAAYNTAQQNLAAHQQAFQNADQTWNATHNANEQLNTNINMFDDATNSIQELNAQIQRHSQELQNWDANHIDHAKDLIAYWDLLETGRTTYSGPLWNFINPSKKSAQNKLNQNKAQIIQMHQQNYSLTA